MRSSDMGWIRTNLDFPILWAFPESLFRAGGVLAVFQFFSFLVLLTELFRNISGDKTEKLKNVFFSREIQGEILHKKTVFQFFSFAYGSIPEHFRRQNWKTVFSREIQGEILQKKKVFQFFSFAYGTIPEHFRRQNWKTFFFMENLSLDLSGKNSFSVFQFCLRNSSGTFPETKLKNWKTVFLWRISPWISLEKTVFQFLSFAYGTLPEHFRRQN